MWLGHRPLMVVLMVRVMDMGVFVLHRLVRVFVFVALGHMEPKTHPHQQSGCNELRRHGFVQQHNSDQRADKGREREVSARAGGAEMPQRQHEENETHPYAKKTNHGG